MGPGALFSILPEGNSFYFLCTLENHLVALYGLLYKNVIL